MDFLSEPVRALRSARAYIPSDQSGDMECMMADLILSDIQAEITRIEKENNRKRRETINLTKTPDYSWLMDWRLKNKKVISCRESSDVELLCAKIKPNEWNCLIREWKTRVKFIEYRNEVTNLFRTIVEEICAKRFQKSYLVHFVDELHPTDKTTRKKKSLTRPWTSQSSSEQTLKSQQRVPQHQMAELSVFALNQSPRFGQYKYYSSEAHDAV